MELAVAAARRAFAEGGGGYWSRAPGAYRAGFLRAIAAKVCSRFRNVLLASMFVRSMLASISSTFTVEFEFALTKT